MESAHFDLQVQDIVIQYRDAHGVEHIDAMASMSDGYRAAVLMFADIARRMAQLNPHLLGNALQTSGIVLIDEVDLHLHPLWQGRVLGDLHRAFPNVQFVVTTHAPAVVASVPNEARILVIENDEVHAAEGMYGHDVNAVMEAVMTAPRRPKTVAGLFAEYYALFDRTRFIEARKKLDDMESLIGSEEPDVSSARVAACVALSRHMIPLWLSISFLDMNGMDP